MYITKNCRNLGFIPFLTSLRKAPLSPVRKMGIATVKWLERRANYPNTLQSAVSINKKTISVPSLSVGGASVHVTHRKFVPFFLTVPH